MAHCFPVIFLMVATACAGDFRVTRLNDALPVISKETWHPARPPQEILKPETEWEGADRPGKPSKGGAQTNVRQLRDPFVFEDRDGSLYLFYSGKGEEGIGVAKLEPN